MTVHKTSTENMIKRQPDKRIKIGGASSEMSTPPKNISKKSIGVWTGQPKNVTVPGGHREQIPTSQVDTPPPLSGKKSVKDIMKNFIEKRNTPQQMPSKRNFNLPQKKILATVMKKPAEKKSTLQKKENIKKYLLTEPPPTPPGKTGTEKEKFKKYEPRSVLKDLPVNSSEQKGEESVINLQVTKKSKVDIKDGKMMDGKISKNNIGSRINFFKNLQNFGANGEQNSLEHRLPSTYVHPTSSQVIVKGKFSKCGSVGQSEPRPRRADQPELQRGGLENKKDS